MPTAHENISEIESISDGNTNSIKILRDVLFEKIESLFLFTDKPP